MRWTVLGASAVRPNPGGACSGYLLEADGARILVDCGAGVVGRLLQVVSPADLTAVLISHGHPDHCLDLVALRQTLRYGPERRRTERLPLYVAPGMDDQLARLGGAFVDDGDVARGDDFWSVDFALRTYDPDVGLALGGVRVTFAPTRHYVPCWAMRFTDARGRSIVYGADGGPSVSVTELARGADLLVLESTFASRAAHPGDAGHQSPDEAGQTAAEAGAQRLLLTHLFSDADLDALRRDAAARCTASVEVAREGMSWTV